MLRCLRTRWASSPGETHSRRKGVFLVVAAVALTAVLTFVALSVDLGNQSLTKTKMQNATDAAALAAAMEITNALQTANSSTPNVFDYALAQARTVGANVAQMNGVYVDPNKDVIFGQRTYVASTQSYTINWGVSSDKVNCVKVVARRDGGNTSAPDGMLPGIFSPVIGVKGFTIKTESVSFIDPRDIVVVHDFSRSMNFDSYYASEQNTHLTQAQIDSNLALVWNDIQPLNLGTMGFNPQYASQTQTNTGASSTVTFKGKSAFITATTPIKSVKLTYTDNSSEVFNISNETTMSGTWSGTGTKAANRIGQVDLLVRKVGSTKKTLNLPSHVYDSTAVINCFGLTNVTYPYAQGSWAEYVNFAQTDPGLAAYNMTDLYGGKTYLSYLMKNRSSYNETKDLWKTRHYPFHAIKEGHELLCDYLQQLGFGDHLGMVSYDWMHRMETTINDTNPDMPRVDISANPISSDFASVKKLMHYKQASHYYDFTNMSGGMKEAVAMLDKYKRSGSRPAIILMTDGRGNVMDTGETASLQTAGWDWNKLFDYDGDGIADYTTTSASSAATLYYAQQAADKGYTVHSICVGVDADRATLKAVAWIGNGYYIDIPGGTDVTQKEEDVKAAFAKIASAVPPARLMPPSP